ncbi:hypothetical protein D9758_007714 [Tetrapyrgos nigripes]|uniref:Uncharacterized protein n=1 Tax=Tetrapyrgos nigripes TaxID=182062 RepID=A0A8H5G5F2_9AGAR|nr:hypothetical protein D9758_007714 [Tetrapyrgos nigripes]
MTEYDYSPEAYQRHMDTQHRIAKWVDNTNAHAHEFRHPFGNRSESDKSSSGPQNRDGIEYRDGRGSRMSVRGSGDAVTRRRNSFTYQPGVSTTKGLTTTTVNRTSYPYPVSRPQIPIPSSPVVPPPKPSPAPVARYTNAPTPTRTQSRPRSLSQSYISSPVTGSTIATRRDPAAHSSHPSRSQVSRGVSGSQSHSRSRSVQTSSHAPHHPSTRAYANPNTGHPPTRSGTYPMSSSKHSHRDSYSSSKPSSSHVKTHHNHTRDRSYSLSGSQARPTLHTTQTPQYVEKSGILLPTSSSRKVYTSSKPMVVGGYTIIPQGKDERILTLQKY